MKGNGKGDKKVMKGGKGKENIKKEREIEGEEERKSRIKKRHEGR